MWAHRLPSIRPSKWLLLLLSSLIQAKLRAQLFTIIIFLCCFQNLLPIMLPPLLNFVLLFCYCHCCALAAAACLLSSSFRWCWCFCCLFFNHHSIDGDAIKSAPASVGWQPTGSVVCHRNNVNVVSISRQRQHLRDHCKRLVQPSSVSSLNWTCCKTIKRLARRRGRPQ